MTGVLQTVIDAVPLGAVYALLAMAIAVVYRASRSVNFGQGELGTFAAFTALALSRGALPLPLAVMAALIVGGVTCGAIYVVLVRPARALGESTTVLIGAALFLGVNSLCAAIWGSNNRAFPSLFPSRPDDFVAVAGLRIYPNVFGNLLIVLAAFALLTFLLTKTTLGLRMRAVAANPESASLTGVPVGLVLVLSWAVAGALGAMSAILAAPDATLSPLLMFEPLLYGMAAAALGGLDSLKGAVIGGFCIAIATALVGAYVPWIGQDLKQGVAMAFIVVMLATRPAGLFGTSQAVRA